MENGLWQNSSSPDSSPISYIGKSTIQQNSYRSASMWPGTAVPSFVRSTPAVFCAAVFLPARHADEAARLQAEGRGDLRLSCP